MLKFFSMLSIPTPQLACTLLTKSDKFCEKINENKHFFPIFLKENQTKTSRIRKESNLSTQKPHSKHIKGLPFHILGTHVDNTLQTKSGTYSSSCNSMLTSSCFGNYALFPQALGKQNLTNSIVNFVRPSVVKIFPFQI